MIAKKILLTGLIFILAFVVSTPLGIITCAEPLLGTDSANKTGNVLPPSVDNKIFTLDALIGLLSVPAASQIISSSDPPFIILPNWFCDLIVNGPALAIEVISILS